MANRLHRSTTNKKIAGVCGGLGEYFNIDPTIFQDNIRNITLARRNARINTLSNIMVCPTKVVLTG